VKTPQSIGQSQESPPAIRHGFGLQILRFVREIRASFAQIAHDTPVFAAHAINTKKNLNGLQEKPTAAPCA
jgi:hypothetical protein